MRMRLAFCVELVERIVEGQPLAEMRAVSLPVLFDLFEDLKIFPALGVVLHGGDAPGGCIGKSQFHGLASLVVSGPRDGVLHSLARRLAQNAGGLAVGIAIDFAALGIAAGDGDAGELQRARIGDGDMAIHATQKNGMIAGDLVDVPTRGQRFHGPKVFVPTAAQDPVAGGGRFAAWRGCARGIHRAISRRPG